MKQTSILFLVALLSLTSFSKKKPEPPVDWASISINEEYKTFNTKASSFKRIAKTPTFINTFSIKQILVQSGKLTNKQSHSTGINLKSTTQVVGIDEPAMRQLSTDLYNAFQKQLKGLGAKIANGEEIVNSSIVQKKASKNKAMYAATGDLKPVPYKTTLITAANAGNLGGYIYATSYHPKNYSYVMDTRSVGNGIYTITPKVKTNFVSVTYEVTFCEFDGSTGGSLTSKSASINTKVRMHIKPTVNLTTDKAGWGNITYKTPVRGNGNFGSVVQTSSKKSVVGTSSSFGYTVEVDPDKYTSELRLALFAVQGAVLELIKSEL